MARNVSGEGIRPHKWRDRWRGGLTIGYDHSGKQKIKWCYGKSERECQEKINAAKRQRDEGVLRTDRSSTLAEWFKHWLEVKKSQVSERTHEEYTYTSRHVLNHLSKVKLDKLTGMQVQKMQLAVLGDVSARAAVKARSLLYNAMSDAQRLGLVSRNVVALVDPVKYQVEEFTIWSAEEVVRFLSSTRGTPYYPFWYTALTTGMRPGELIALHWSDLDGNRLHVRRTVSVVGNKPVLKNTTKTARGKRILVLPDDTLELLEAERTRSVYPLVFPSRTGSFLSHRNLRRALHTYADAAEGHANVSAIRVHDLRHTYASMRIADGVDIMTLSRDLGHSSPSFTLNRYGHIFERHRQRSAPTLGTLLGIDNGISNGTEPIRNQAKNERVQDLPS